VLLPPLLEARILNPTWAQIIAHIGIAILTAGAVTTFMGFFASLDIVGERIWLADEKYLAKLCERLCDAVYAAGGQAYRIIRPGARRRAPESYEWRRRNSTVPVSVSSPIDT
jgi:hypothetical protein